MPSILAFFLTYLLPGYGAAALFEGRQRWNPFLWVLLSLFLVPVGMSAMGALGVPARSAGSVAAALTLLSAGLFALSRLSRRRGFALRLPRLGASDSALPRALAALLLLMLTLQIAQTRLSLFSGRWPVIGDDLFRVTHATAVATTGVPPRNPFLPEARLSYYYYDLMIPGLVARLAAPQLSVARSLAIHIVLQTLVVGVALAAVLFWLVPPWAAILGLFWMTFGGGWDSLAAILFPGATGDGWAYEVLPGTFQIHLPIMLAQWVPQHLIAAASVPLAVALMREVEGPLWLRAVLFGVLLAFDAGSSVFVSIGLGAGIALWLALPQTEREGAWSRRQTLLALATGALLGSSVLPMYWGHEQGLMANFPSRNPADAEGSLSGAFLWRFIGAEAATAYRVPVHLVLDGGIPFVLFAVWLWRERRHLRCDAAAGFLAAVGVAFVPLAYLVRSRLYQDFGMRGIIPAELAWAMGAALLLGSPMPVRAARASWALALAGTLVALPSLAPNLHATAPESPPLPRYIEFLHRNTSLDDPIVVADSFSFVTDLSRYGLERLRLIDPWYVRKMQPVDLQYLKRLDLLPLPAQPQPLRTAADVCRAATRAAAPGGEVLVLARPQSSLVRTLGQPRFTDESFAVFGANCGGLAGASPAP